MKSVLWLLSVLVTLAACGGGGGSSGSPAPTPPPPVAPDEPLTVLDALPSASAGGADPGLPDVTFSHLGYSDFSLAVEGGCSGSSVRRSVSGLSVDFDSLYEHRLTCSSLGENANVELSVQADRANGDGFEVTHRFATGLAQGPGLTVQSGISTPGATVRSLFDGFVETYLVDELALPGAVRFVVEPLVDLIAEAAWQNLVAPELGEGVVSQRVSYASRSPSGEPSAAVTALVAHPDLPAGSRAPIIVLMHSTGVTPSDLAPSNAWFVLANLIASKGYLVVAPDNFGRGGTEPDEETYLLGNRTAVQGLDLLRAVIAEPAYAPYFDAANPSVQIVGYSQGGHSAAALWLALATQAPEIGVDRVVLGGAPLDLYATVSGAVDFVAGTCTGGPYCRYVDADTSVPFVTDRILPPYSRYVDLGFAVADVVEGETLRASFTDGYQANAPQYDALKAFLQQQSYPNLDIETIPAAGTTFELYHSDYDRLVAAENSRAFVETFGARWTVRLDSSACNGTNYEAIFAATDIVGISHALCGFDMLDDVFATLE